MSRALGVRGDQHPQVVGEDGVNARHVEAQIKRLETEHGRLMERWGDLPTPLARERARQKFVEIESCIEELKQQLQDAAGVVRKAVQGDAGAVDCNCQCQAGDEGYDR
jgi:hypothetical protein